MTLPKIEVTLPDGERVLMRVTVNGVEIPATRVRFDTGDINDRTAMRLPVTVTVDLLGELHLVGPGVWLAPPDRTALWPRAIRWAGEDVPAFGMQTREGAERS